jgi:DNA-directed RNA polymerase subunit F
MNKKDTIMVVYPGGAYGTFVEWAMAYFSGELEDERLPFRTTGSSHNYVGHPLDFIKYPLTAEEYFSSDANYKFVRWHCSENYEYVAKHIDKYKKFVKYVVSLYDDQDSRLLVHHNAITKTMPEISEKFVKHINSLCNVSADDARWEIREKYSFYFRGIYNFESVWRYPEDDDQVINVSVSELISDFPKCIRMIFEKTGLTFDSERVKSIDDITAKWLSLQKFANLQNLCKKIVSSVVNDKPFEWNQSDLTIYAEAFIQMMLRDLHGLDLRCYNINEFPTNSHDLKQLTFHVESI